MDDANLAEMKRARAALLRPVGPPLSMMPQRHILRRANGHAITIALNASLAGKARLSQAIALMGGQAVDGHDGADLVLTVPHEAPGDAPENMVDVAWLYDCAYEERRLNTLRYRIDVMRYEERGLKSPKRRRHEFSADDDLIIMRFLTAPWMIYISSENTYDVLARKFPQHTRLSWRERAIKHAKPHLELLAHERDAITQEFYASGRRIEDVTEGTILQLLHARTSLADPPPSPPAGTPSIFKDVRSASRPSSPRAATSNAARRPAGSNRTASPAVAAALSAATAATAATAARAATTAVTTAATTAAATAATAATIGTITPPRPASRSLYGNDLQFHSPGFAASSPPHVPAAPAVEPSEAARRLPPPFHGQARTPPPPQNVDAQTHSGFSSPVGPSGSSSAGSGRPSPGRQPESPLQSPEAPLPELSVAPPLELSVASPLERPVASPQKRPAEWLATPIKLPLKRPVASTPERPVASSPERHVATSPPHQVASPPKQVVSPPRRELESRLEHQVTSSPERPVASTPSRHVATSPERPVATLPRPHMATLPERPVASTPRPHVATLPERPVASTPEPHVALPRKRPSASKRPVTSPPERPVASPPARTIESLSNDAAAPHRGRSASPARSSVYPGRSASPARSTVASSPEIPLSTAVRAAASWQAHQPEPQPMLEHEPESMPEVGAEAEEDYEEEEEEEDEEMELQPTGSKAVQIAPEDVIEALPGSMFRRAAEQPAEKHTSQFAEIGDSDSFQMAFVAAIDDLKRSTGHSFEDVVTAMFMTQGVSTFAKDLLDHDFDLRDCDRFTQRTLWLPEHDRVLMGMQGGPGDRNRQLASRGPIICAKRKQWLCCMAYMSQQLLPQLTPREWLNAVYPKAPSPGNA